jgi:hypothetical protein
MTNDRQERKQCRVLAALPGFMAMLLAAIRFLLLFTSLLRTMKREYHAQYDGSASMIITSFEEIPGKKLAAISSLSVAATSYARQPNYLALCYTQRLSAARG